jgi:aspartate carbamoyltransferase regulatory subunit
MTEITRKVGTIKNGVVIDHITNGKGLEISKILKLDQFFEFVVIAQNLNSNKLGKKDLIKIEGKELTIDELNKIALITKSPTIKYNKRSKNIS